MLEKLITIPLLAKAAPILLPLAATLCKHLLGKDETLFTELIGTCIDEAKDATKDRLEEALKKQPDLVLALNQKVFMDYTGWVLGALIRQFSQQPQFEAHQADLELFADQAPGGWKVFVLKGSPGLTPVHQDAFLRQMAESMARDGSLPSVNSVPFTIFFNWHVRLPQDVKQKLDTYLKTHLDNALQVLLLSDAPEAQQTYREITLSGIHEVQKTLRYVQQQLRQHGELLEDLRESPGFHLAHYAEKLALHCERIPFSDKAGNKTAQPITLSAIFIEPTVRAYRDLDPRLIAANRDVLAAIRSGSIDDLSPEQQEIARPLMEHERQCPPQPAFHTLFDPTNNGHIILAHAGVGKSSLVRRIALRWACQFCGTSDAALPEPLPLLIELKSFASAYAKDSTLTLLGFLHGCEESLDRLDRIWCLHYLRTGAAVLILDGLDEVTRHETRQAVANGASRLRRLGVRVLVTSRREGFIAEHWQQQTQPWTGWLLDEFSPEQRSAFIDLMLPRLYASEHDIQSKRAELHRRIQHQPALGQLSTNPLLLTLITVLQRTGRLGDSRIALYREASELLLDQWEAEHFGPTHIPLDHGIPCDADTRREIVRHLALKFVGDENTDLPCFAENLFGIEIFKDAIREVVDPSRTNPGAANMAAQYLPDYLNERHSVICYSGEDPKTGERLFSFIHRTFLEYFIALAWVEEIDNENAADLRHCEEFLLAENAERIPRWRDERFANILPFYFGLLSEAFQKKRLPLLWKLFPNGVGAESVHHEAILFAASVWGEVANRDRKHPEFSAQLQLHLISLAELLDRNLSDGDHHTYREFEQSRCVVRALAQLFGREPAVDAWLRQRLTVTEISETVRWEIIEQLHTLHGSTEQLRTQLHELAIKAENGVETRNTALRAIDIYWGAPGLLRALGVLKDQSDLTDLNLSICIGLVSLPDLSAMKGLRILRLAFCTGLNGPEALSGLTGLGSLEYLDLSDCTGLESLPDLSVMRRLNAIHLDNCTRLNDAQALSGLIGLGQLEYLYLNGCTGLESLPDLSAMQGLKTLELSGCTGLHGSEALSCLTGLGQLEKLDLSGCTGLESLPDLRAMQGLKTLSLIGCSGLNGPVALSGLTGLGQLEELYLHGCTGLESLPDLRAMQGLKTLALSGCSGLNGPEAFRGLTGLGQLEELYLHDCTGLVDLPDLSAVQGLKTLDLSGCTELRGSQALSGLTGLGQLKKLYLNGCTGLTEADVEEIRQRVGPQCQVLF